MKEKQIFKSSFVVKTMKELNQPTLNSFTAGWMQNYRMQKHPFLAFVKLIFHFL